MTKAEFIKAGFAKASLTFAKASLTIEASFLIPLALFAILGGINIGYNLFQQAEDASQIHIELEQLDPADLVRKNTLLQGLKE